MVPNFNPLLSSQEQQQWNSLWVPSSPSADDTLLEERNVLFPVFEVIGSDDNRYPVVESETSAEMPWQAVSSHDREMEMK
jgi:hypothetical protein